MEWKICWFVSIYKKILSSLVGHLLTTRHYLSIGIRKMQEKKEAGICAIVIFFFENVEA